MIFLRKQKMAALFVSNITVIELSIVQKGADGLSVREGVKSHPQNTQLRRAHTANYGILQEGLIH